MILDLFLIFLRIGAFTLGGGYAMLGMVEKTIVEDRKWLGEEEFSDMIAIVQSIPGVFAVNTALYVGYRLKGKRGAASAALGAVLPSFLIILLIASYFVEIKDNDVVLRVFKGIRPCVVALILAPSVKMITKLPGQVWTKVWVPLVCAFLVWHCGVSPIMLIFAGIVFGVVFCYYRNWR